MSGMMVRKMMMLVAGTRVVVNTRIRKRMI
jgi:hypothetical protein